MKVLLLAGGQSTRLAPISDKILLNFCGKTLLEHQIETISKCGLSDFIIIGNCFNLKEIKLICENLPQNFQFAEQKDLNTGMSGCVLAIESLLSQDEDLLIVSTNDFVEENAYHLMLEAIRRHPFSGLLLGKSVKNYFPGGYLKINSENRIEEIIEKPLPGTEPSDLINLVVHYHPSAFGLLQALKKVESQKDDLYEIAINNQIKQNSPYFVVPYHGFWQALKYPWHILDLQKYFLENLHSHIDSSVFLGKNTVIQGHIYLGKNVKIYENAIIKGPVYLGDNCVVANNALIRESIIGSNSIIGFSTEVARSYLGEQVWTHSNYIGDSVIDSNVSFGAGCVTGNLRFDEQEIEVEIKSQKTKCGKNKLGALIGKNCRFGINTSLMPGIKIGANSLIGAGITLQENVPESSFVNQKNSNLKIVPNLFLKNLPNRENFRNKL